MTNPPPRPALTKSADAEVHPARPALPIPLRSLPTESPGHSADAKSKKSKRPSTSDTLTGPVIVVPDELEPKHKGKAKKKAKDKTKGKDKVQAKAKLDPPTGLVLTPELLQDLTRKAEAHGYEPTEVIELLVRAWLDN